TNRYWDFGDGNTSSFQNPEHTFESLGEYQVNLTVTNDGGSSTKLQNITVAYFGAYFIANKTSGSIPLTIQFTDTSVGDYDTWNWSVDDGTLHWYNKTIYADRNLEYTFNNVGSWRVNLSVQNISESGPIYSTSMNITATNVPPVASFTGYPSAGTTSTTFIFNSTSTGIITTYNWSFGDGNYSATQNTTHVFPSNGIYNVNLTVSNDGGSSYIVHPFTVSAFSVSTSISPTSGVIPLLVTFNETYSGLIPDSYYWEFGDGATSTDKNTTHTYTTIGTFNVNHRIMNGSIISWANTTSAVTALGGSVTANFTANVTAGDYPLDVQFTDTSTYINATPSSWYWTFGDGLTSTSQNPSHTYSNAGTYSVNFTTTTDYGVSYLLRSAYISVGGVAANGRQDIILTNTNNIVTLYIKDSNSGNLITHAAVSDEMGNELTSYGNGIFSGSYSTGQHTFTANATDYYTNRATYLISGDLIQTIYLTQVATSVSTTWYTPKTIVISFVDAYGNQVRGASVNARFNETTLPNGVSDLISNYGMNVNVANEALNGTLLMSGSTDYQGSIVFTMLSALKYDIAITYNGETNYYSIYPQDSQYQFRFLTTVATDNIWDDLYANGNTKVWATEPDPSNVTFWWSFQDMTSLTTRVDFYLKDVDLDTMVYITNVTSPVAGNIYQLNYTVPNVRGKNYLVWGNYTRDV
ncbi:MAG: PKD domain-containing protein, partial [Candidatus Cloacimonetes bacterium]|nr:PKD domain-containing protein [Candidatus Cloacimonadota bacterium]